ncbi:uncharacterized protein LOC114251721 [Bombyx mandarina]|uniref:Uncharacterized protein LOC114251721 n=1 Tax=Bombyx mandarina TaxID=7092 RepID=A0A6J2KHS8_BOMMA|nr:uncharacterized protein LOC114251721 [Bombyx mandarina]
MLTSRSDLCNEKHSPSFPSEKTTAADKDDTEARCQVDSSLERLLLPFTLVQYVSFIPMYSIRRGLVSPDGPLAYLYSLLGFCLFTSISVYRNAILHRTRLSSLHLFTLYSDLVSFVINYSLSLICNVVNSKSNVEFVCRLQRLQTVLRRYQREQEQFARSNWAYLAAVTALYLAVVGLLNVVVLKQSLPDTLYLLLLFCIDVNVLYATRMLALLRCYLQLWTRKINEKAFNPVHHNMFTAYLDILQEYEVYTTLFKKIITYYVLETFLHGLLYVQVAIQICKSIRRSGRFSEQLMMIVSIFTWTIKNMIIMTLHNVECEKFYLAAEQAVAACQTQRASTTRCREEKRLYKNVCRVSRAAFSRERGWGLLAAGAALTLRFMDLATTYVTVLLQFAFVSRT